MTKELSPIPFNEFSDNLTSFFERVIRESRPVIVENDKGERAVLKPLASRKTKGRARTEADYKAFLASFGSWEDVNIDEFLKDNYASRARSIRPPVEL